MSLIRWSPTRALSAFPSDMFTMEKEMSRMLDAFFTGGSQVDSSFDGALWSPAADIAEHDAEYVVKLELPGVSKEDVKITLHENILTVRGEKKQEKEAKGSNYSRVERTYGSFQRSFTLPASVQHDKIEAEYRDGILTVKLPKAEESKPKHIEVKVK